MSQQFQAEANSESIVHDDRISTFEEMCEFFERENVGFEVDDAAPFICLDLHHGGLNNAIVLRWDADDGVLHFIESLPIDIPKDRFSDVESAMLRINHVNVYPGLGMNYNHDIAFFRMTMLLVPRGFLHEHEIRVCLDFTMRQTERWFPKINAVVNGEIRSDDLESLLS